jgi:hypothetical protein
MATKSRTGDQSIISNQLSLFSDVTDAELGDNLIEESTDARNGHTHAPWIPDPGTLETPPAVDGREPQTELNSLLDLDKGDQQGAAPVPDQMNRRSDGRHVHHHKATPR